MIRPRRKPRRGRLKGKDLEALRLACFERDLGRCQRCGRETFLNAPQERDYSYHMAHKKGKAMWGDYLENVEVNCGLCHRRYHWYGPSMEKPCPSKVWKIITLTQGGAQ